ncbi:MAG: 3-oxoacyl-[acyl-carrier-protein] synthase II [Chloroflexi bacterium]|nr:MAG: 3-oxoacyl-[acyl-carrier-protein] synthase II [Chloroflexota bacterium]
MVITGIGTVNPVGLNAVDTWAALMSAKSGISNIESFDPDEYGIRTKIAGEVKGFDPDNWMDRKEARRMGRFSQFALAAAKEAVDDSGLKLEGATCQEVGVVIASGVGGLTTVIEQAFVLRDKGARRVSPFAVPMLMPNAAAGVISIHLGCRGPSFATASACASSADALGVALDTIRMGRAKAMLAGGTEATIIPVCVASFEQAHALNSNSNDEPEKASRPFDVNRDGFVLSEGAAVLVLEEEEYAKARGARIIAELAGYGAASDGFHITAPDPGGIGAIQAMTVALSNAEAGSDEVIYINAHGTSTQLNDKIEALAVSKVFGHSTTPISSTKSMTGHLAGAAGALEALICAKTVETGVAAPTINYDNPDPECDVDCIPWKPREIGKGVILSNSFGFGGHSSCLAFRPYDL